MARVSSFEVKDLQRNSVHDAVDATYSIFEENGDTFFQIDTYGRKDRKIPGKRSQSIQFDRQAASHLVDLLRSSFKL